MTCIIGLKTEQGVWMGADSAISMGWETRRLVQPKLIQRDGLIIGGSGRWRALALAQTQALPERFGACDPYTYVAGPLVETLRGIFKNHEVRPVGEEENPLDMLIALEGRLFLVDGFFGVAEFEDDFNAIGSGREYALGALAILPDYLSPPERIKKALTVAARFSMAVKPPFVIEYLPNKREVAGEPIQETATH